MTSILIPFDYSETAENALQYAISLFEETEVQFTLLNIYISNRSELMSDDYNNKWFDEVDNDAEKKMNNYIQGCNQFSEDNHHFQGVVKANTFINAVKDAVIEKKIDVVVTGTEGARSLKEEFIGTNTMKVINHLDNLPILVVPFNYSYKPLKKIIFSTNFKRDFSKNELQSLLEISTKKRTNIEVVWLSDEQYLSLKQKANKKLLEMIFEEYDVTFKRIDWIDSETTSLENHIENSQSDMLALINHKLSFFSRLTEENVIKKSTFHSKVPLLILPEL